MYIDRIKKITPPKTSPQKYAKKCSRSLIDECNLESPILLKNAEKVIMTMTKVQPLY